MWSREDSRRCVITGSDVSDEVIKHDLVSGIELNITHYFSTKRNICTKHNTDFSRPQGKVMFSQVYVCPRESPLEGDPLQTETPPLDSNSPLDSYLLDRSWTWSLIQTETSWTENIPGERPPSSQRPPLPPVLTSSGGHCSSRYASYWNAFLCLTRLSSTLDH